MGVISNEEPNNGESISLCMTMACEFSTVGIDFIIIIIFNEQWEWVSCFWTGDLSESGSQRAYTAFGYEKGFLTLHCSSKIESVPRVTKISSFWCSCNWRVMSDHSPEIIDVLNG